MSKRPTRTEKKINATLADFFRPINDTNKYELALALLRRLAIEGLKIVETDYD